MALVALGDRDHLAPRGHRGAVHREVEHFVDGAVFARALCCGARQLIVSPRRPSMPIEKVPVASAGITCVKRVGASAVAAQLAVLDRVLGNIALVVTSEPKLRVAVVRRRTGQDESQAAVVPPRQSAPSDTALPALSFTVKVTVGALPATPLSHSMMSTIDAGRVADSVGNRVRALDGSVEFQFALRNVALRALVVGDLRQVDVVLAGGEVHVVVAGAASCAVGLQLGGRSGSARSLPGSWQNSQRPAGTSWLTGNATVE